MSEKNKKAKIRANLFIYLKWPMILSVLLIIMTILIYNTNEKAGIIAMIFLGVYMITAFYLQLNRYNSLMPAIMKFTEDNARAQGDFITKIDIPYAILDVDGDLLWANGHFLGINQKLKVGDSILKVFTDFKSEIFKELGDTPLSMLTSVNEKKFKAYFISQKLKNIENNENYSLFDNKTKIIIMYLLDQTSYFDLKEDFDGNKQVTGLIYIDNYEEVTENMEDSKASMLLAMVDRKLSRYISHMHGVIKKLEKDKFFFIMTKKDIEEMIKDRFSILEQVKDIINNDNLPLTISIGVGYEGQSLEFNNELARLSMDMALGRGGDQAVVKKGTETYFYGGKSASQVSNERVRARVKATSFKEILDTKDRVFVMGHKNADPDSFGAAIGVAAMAKFIGKEVYIVMNSATNGTNEIKNRFLENESYQNDVFIDGDKAVSLSDNNSLLVVVDHNNKDLSDEPRLYETIEDMVVFDHHRITTNAIDSAIMSYIEPGSSSTVELVSELMSYFDERIRLKSIEADAMLAGMMIDTQNFTQQTTARTFESASYLKKNGADISRVRKYLRNDWETENTILKAIQEAEIYKDEYAICVIESNPNIETSVVKAEIANELININGVNASIVLSHEGEKYNVSSRSLDEINVQIIMEYLGGGGHRNQAGCIIEINDIEKVKEVIKEAIDKYILSQGRK